MKVNEARGDMPRAPRLGTALVAKLHDVCFPPSSLSCDGPQKKRGAPSYRITHHVLDDEATNTVRVFLPLFSFSGLFSQWLGVTRASVNRLTS